MKYANQEFVKNAVNLADQFLHDLKNDDKVVCAGGGYAFYWYHKFFTEHGVSVDYILDKNASEKGSSKYGIPAVNQDYILNKGDLSGYKFVVTAPKFREEIIQELLETLGEVKIYSFEAEIYYTYIKNIESYRQYILEHWKELEELEEILEDDESQRTLGAFIKGRVSGDQRYFIEAMKSGQYFPEDIIKLTEDEIIVEVGSNDGRTLLDILERTNRRYQKIYCFEPDRECVLLLEDILQKEQGNIELIKKGVGNQVSELRFKSDSEWGASHVVTGNDYDYCIDITTLEHEIKGQVTYIKMDIEGMELDALKGAECLIREYRPKLAICVYHNKQDIIEILQYLKSLDVEYKFYLRHHNWGATETVLYAICE